MNVSKNKNIYNENESQFVVYDIKRFAIYDGPGIRTTIFFKGCNLKCGWCHNPEGINSQVELFYNEDKCIKCNKCLKVCPLSKVKNSVKNRFSKEVECLSNCIECYKVCPSDAIYKVGEVYSVKEIVEECLKDKEFYKFSGGGVTLSGGEPLLQSQKLVELLARLKENGINVTIETNGYANWEILKKMINLVDLFYYDLKLIDEYSHREFTGGSNKWILENLIWLSKQEVNIVIRVPLITSVTDTELNIRNIINFIKEHKLEEYKVELLPFNELSKVKYNKIGINSKDIKDFFNNKIVTQSKKKLFEIKKLFTENNIKVKILSVD